MWFESQRGAGSATDRHYVMRLNIVHIIVLVLFFALGCDRPLTFDAQGIAHGTGEKVYNYKTGARRSCARGIRRWEARPEPLVQTGWVRLIQETKWADGAGEGIYLREDVARSVAECSTSVASPKAKRKSTTRLGM